MKRARRPVRDLVIAVIIPAMIGLGVAGMITSCVARAAAPAAREVTDRCVVVIDPDSGATIRSEGACAGRSTPESTFKIVLAVMGFATGVLKDAHDPAWEYDGRFPAPQRDRRRVDPAAWQRDSVIWYSRELTRRMAEREGPEVLARWVKRLGYGN